MSKHGLMENKLIFFVSTNCIYLFIYSLMRYCLIRSCHFNYNAVTPDSMQLTLRLKCTLTSTIQLLRL